MTAQEPDELFDVVDETDRVIGQEQRCVVHQRGLRHRAVQVFVVNSEGRLLIHRRPDWKTEFPGVWTSSCAGHVSAGESYDVAAARELSEELGIEGPLQPLRKFDACPETCMEFTWLYSCEWNHEVLPDPQEIMAVRWLSRAELVNELAAFSEQYSPAFHLLFGWWRAFSRSG